MIFALLAALGVALHAMLGWSLGLAWAVLFVAWPAAGTLITADDDLPGGWSNPDGSRTPAWRDPTFGGQLLLGAAVACLGFAYDLRDSRGAAVCIVAAGLVLALVGNALRRRDVRRRGTAR